MRNAEIFLNFLFQTSYTNHVKEMLLLLQKKKLGVGWGNLEVFP